MNTFYDLCKKYEEWTNKLEKEKTIYSVFMLAANYVFMTALSVTIVMSGFMLVIYGFVELGLYGILPPLIIPLLVIIYGFVKYLKS